MYNTYTYKYFVKKKNNNKLKHEVLKIKRVINNNYKTWSASFRGRRKIHVRKTLPSTLEGYNTKQKRVLCHVHTTRTHRRNK